MFYSTHMLGRKGPLAVIWVAAHKDPKFLKRAFVDTTSINAACETIMFPEAPLALRLSGQLVLGVVRVYYRQLEFLDDDAAAAFAKLLKAEKKGNNADSITAAPNAHTAPPKSINLPESSHMSDLDYGFISHDLDHLMEDVTPKQTPTKAGLQLEERRTSFLLMHEDSQYSGMDPYINNSQDLGEIDRFEKAVDGFEPDGHLDFGNFSATFDTPEVVRAAPADNDPELRRGDIAADLAASTPSYVDGGGPDMGGNDMGDYMQPVIDGATLEHVPTPATVAPPLSTAKSVGASHDVLPGLELEFDAAEDEQPRLARAPTRDAAMEARRRRMQAAQDVTCDGAPALQLSRAGITALLKDRAPLMRGRGADAHKRLKIAPSAHAVVLQSSAAEGNPLFRMASCDTLAPRLYAQVRHAMGPVTSTIMAPPPPRLPECSAPTDDPIPQTDQHGEAHLPSTPFENGGGMGDGPDYGGFGDGGPTPMTGEEDPIEADGPENPLLPTNSRRNSLQLSARSISVAVGTAEEEEATGQGDGDKLLFAKWLHGELSRCGPKGSAVLSKGQGIMKGKGRLFQARAFYSALALQAQDCAPVDVRQERPLGYLLVTRAKGFASWHPSETIRA